MAGFQNLDGEAKLLADTINEICEEYDHDYWHEYAKTNDHPDELWDTLCDRGFSGMNVPEEYGGTDMSMYHTAVVLERLARHGVLCGFLVVSSTMAPIPIKNHGSGELKERFLPGIASGDVAFSFATTEADAGTNTYKNTMSARREGDEYVLEGEKTWISEIDDADYVIVVARTTPLEEAPDDKPGYGITTLIVDANDSNLDYAPMDLSITSASQAHTVHFNGVRVPVENRIGPEDEGFYLLFDALIPERVAVAAECVGFGRFALDRGASYAQERDVWDQPIGAHQAVQHKLAKPHVKVELAALATEESARAFDDGRDEAGVYGDIAKYAASEYAYEAIENAVQIHGGAGFMPEHGVINVQSMMQHMRVAPVNNEMMLNSIAEKSLDLPKSY